MKTNKITGEELGKMLGVGQSAISSYVTDVAFPNPKALLIIRSVFKTSIDAMLLNDLSRILIKSNILDSVKEDLNEYGKEKNKQWEVTEIYVPIVENTEGGILESLIKRVEQLEKDLKELKETTKYKVE